LAQRQVTASTYGRLAQEIRMKLGFVRTDANLAEAAGEIDPGFVDLVVIGLAFELDTCANGQTVVERGLADEMHFGVVEEAVSVAFISEPNDRAPQATAVSASERFKLTFAKFMIMLARPPRPAVSVNMPNLQIHHW